VNRFEYARAETIQDVVTSIGGNGAGATRPLAGGTDLLTLMKADVARPSRLIDVKRVAELSSSIEETGDGLTLGALVTLAEIEESRPIQERYSALAEAAAEAATPQLRNMATLGGNLLQRPRCWYFRDARFHCWLKGGAECQARDGENQLHALFDVSPCVAVHPSDLPNALIALDAVVRLRGPSGERTLPLAELYAPPTEDRRVETVLGDDELIVSLRLPTPAAGARSTYLKAMDRKVWAFALVGVAASARIADGRIADARLVLGGVAPVPWPARAAEQALLGAEPSPDLFARAAEAALADAAPLEHNAYKLPLAKTLIQRALGAVTGDGVG
jgi:xanthine dehydrogenase YagS FAD-binding subunit